ncbi:MASE1 domain-containing protein [Caulobacter segnis]
MVIVAASILTAIGAILVNGLIAVSGGHAFFRGWADWTTSNVLGVAVILPVALILMDRRHREGFHVRPLEAAATLLLVIATSSWVFVNDATFAGSAVRPGPAGGVPRRAAGRGRGGHHCRWPWPYRPCCIAPASTSR